MSGRFERRLFVLAALVLLTYLPACRNDDEPPDATADASVDVIRDVSDSNATSDSTARDTVDTTETTEASDSSNDADTSEPAETDGTTDGSSPPPDSSSPPDASPACAPIQEKDGDYYVVRGDVDERPTCKKVCQSACLTCDGQYDHFIFGAIGMNAGYGEDGEEAGASGDCDKQPKKEMAGINGGGALQLHHYDCYCRPN